MKMHLVLAALCGLFSVAIFAAMPFGLRPPPWGPLAPLVGVGYFLFRYAEVDHDRAERRYHDLFKQEADTPERAAARIANANAADAELAREVRAALAWSALEDDSRRYVDALDNQKEDES